MEIIGAYSHREYEIQITGTKGKTFDEIDRWVCNNYDFEGRCPHFIRTSYGEYNINEDSICLVYHTK